MKRLLVPVGETRGTAPLDIFGDKVWIKLAGADVNGTYSIMEDHTGPQCGPPLHRHSREDESFYVLEGNYVFEVDGERVEASQGCSVFVARGTAHTFQNVGSTTGRMLIVVQPGGLDEFFTELDDKTRGMSEPVLSVVVPIFEKYGLELLGPPLAVQAMTSAAG